MNVVTVFCSVTFSSYIGTLTTKKLFFDIVLRMCKNTVSLKLLPFWDAEPQIWFTQAEVQLALWKIFAHNTNYFYVLSAIDKVTPSLLKDFISYMYHLEVTNTRK